MSFEEEIASMETAIGSLITATLSNIRKKWSGSNDFVLLDTNDNFKTLFLETAKNKIDYAYNAYLMQAKFRQLISTSNNNITNGTEKPLVSQSNEPSTFEDKKGAESLTAVCSTADNRQLSVSSDISPIEKNRQLQLQNELQNTVFVFGLPLRGGDQEWLLSLFISMCQHISLPIDATEHIEDIQSVCDAFTVTFRNQYKKNEVLAKFERSDLRSDRVLKLLPGEMSLPVKVRQGKTPFYKRLSTIAQRYVKCKRLYCYRIMNRGLGIMFARHDKKFVYVQSPYELEELILQYESMNNNQ